jgi:hypothetical protein
MDADVEEFRAGARQHRRGAGALGALLGGSRSPCCGRVSRDCCPGENCRAALFGRRRQLAVARSPHHLLRPPLQVFELNVERGSGQKAARLNGIPSPRSRRRKSAGVEVRVLPD